MLSWKRQFCCRWKALTWKEQFCTCWKVLSWKELFCSRWNVVLKRSLCGFWESLFRKKRVCCLLLLMTQIPGWSGTVPGELLAGCSGGSLVCVWDRYYTIFLVVLAAYCYFPDFKAFYMLHPFYNWCIWKEKFFLFSKMFEWRQDTI